MIRVEEVNGNDMKRIQKVLAGIPNGVNRAVSSALKRAADSGKTQAGRFAAAKYTISKGTFMSNVNVQSRVYGAGGGDASMDIRFAGSVLNLARFKTGASSGGIFAQARRDSGGGTIQHAFRAPSLGNSIFERVGTSRLPIERKYGPSTGHMMQNEDVIREMDKVIGETYEKRIEHEILRLLNGWGG